MYTLGSKILAHLKETDSIVSGNLTYPISCEIDTSNYCQNNCEWCIYKDYLKANRCHLDLDLYKEIVNQLKFNGCKSITFTGGGEPTMNPNIKEMIDFAYRKGFKLGLITNGIRLNEIKERLFKFEFVRVSLDAINAFQYALLKHTNYFSIVCKNIEEAASMDLTDIGISMVYSTGGWKLAEQFHSLGQKLGVTYSQVKPVVNDKVEKTNKEINGLIGQVAADGKYYYCCVHRGKEDFCVGNLRKNNINELTITRRNFVPDLTQCSTCRYVNYAEEYKKVQDPKFRMLRHSDHL